MVSGEGNAGLAVLASEGIFGDIPNSIVAGMDGCCESTAVTVAGTSSQIPTCPNHCPPSTKIYRDGLRYNENGSTVQRWLCSNCGLRFSNNPLKINSTLTNTRQICAKGAKNLHVPTRKHVGAGVLNDETKALITVFEGWLKKEGYSESRYPNNLKTLVYLGANLDNSEDVKEKLGAHKIKDGAKLQYVYAYEAFLAMQKKTWQRPHYKQEETIPFIPEENELDQLISAAQSRRMATYLQTLKETFADPGEGLKIERKDISGNTIAINHPVKGHRPRVLQVSNQLIAMINSLPNKSERVFATTYHSMCDSYIRLRKRVAEATKNERINYIELRTFRHWGGTMIAELSNGNVITVMKMLGHKRVENSMKYINIYMLKFRKETDYDVLTVSTPDELKTAIAGGWELVCEKFGLMYFRRVKRISFAGTPISQRNSCEISNSAQNTQNLPIENTISKRKTDIISLK